MSEASINSRDTVPVKARIDFVDGIRALAALYVVLHHIWLTTYPNYLNDPGPVGLRWLAYGNIAVSVFIVVSGFSLSIAPARNGWRLKGGVWLYITRRAWRILPTYWAALAVSCLVYGAITGEVTADKITTKAVVVHALLVQDIINSPKPNGAFWSIAVEWQIYFLFPLFLLLVRHWGVRWLSTLVPAAIVVVYLSANHFDPLQKLLNVTPQFVALFVLGIAAAHSVRLGSTSKGAIWSGLLAASLSAAFVTICAVSSIGWVESNYFWMDYIAGAATAFTLAFLNLRKRNPFRRFLASAPLRTVGGFSYSMYCVHLPILWLTWYFIVSKTNIGSSAGKFALLTCIGVPLVILGSYCFSLIFEKPFLKHRSFQSLWKAMGADRIFHRRSNVPGPPSARNDSLASGPGPTTS